MTLLAEVNESSDAGLWDTLRATEERVMLLRQREKLARTHHSVANAERCKRQADETEKRLKPLRGLVLDPKVFGHDQQVD
jgi:two-component system chemotaxis response regulator CheB